MKYDCESSVEKFVGQNGKTFWAAYARVYNTVHRKVESVVQAPEQIAEVIGRGRVDIGEPWPDPATPAGLQRLLEIAERLAMEEWERRYGGGK